MCVAEWDAKLGLQSGGARAVPLASIVHGGGHVPLTRVVVQRTYPVVYMETLPDGTKVNHS